MGEAKTTRRPSDVLVAHGLGSCIALCMRDPVARVSGMAHIVLPHHVARGTDATLGAKFADLAVPYLLNEMVKEGAAEDQLKIAVVGAAQLFGGEEGKRLDIGNRNTVAVLGALKARGLRLIAHDVGGTFGRICQLFAHDGRVLVRAIGSGERELTVLGTKEGTK
jgi:chemotaxis protein CheD